MNSYRKMIIAMLLAFPVLFYSCSQNPSSPEDEYPAELNSVKKELVEADNKFGFKLFNKIVEAEADENIFISPLSISMALGMTLNGAESETRTAMEATLELNGISQDDINASYQNLTKYLYTLDPKVQFQLANSIWYRQGITIEQDFIDLNKTYFDAEVVALDFSKATAADIMNQWIEDHTNGRIKNMIKPPISAATIMFLINAIYFKGDWTFQFNEDETRQEQFTLPDGATTECEMMSQRCEYSYYESNDFQAIELPYGDGDFTMTIFLPHSDKNIDDLIASLSNNNYNLWLTNFAKDSVTLYMPKFKLNYKTELRDVLTTLGMGIAFSSQADFTKMYAPGNVAISKVLHQSFIEVNEEGTEAAAATVVEMELTSVPGSKNIIMRIDRPFLFVIQERQSRSILFVGKIINPSTEEDS